MSLNMNLMINLFMLRKKQAKTLTYICNHKIRSVFVIAFRLFPYNTLTLLSWFCYKNFLFAYFSGLFKFFKTRIGLNQPLFIHSSHSAFIASSPYRVSNSDLLTHTLFMLFVWISLCLFSLLNYFNRNKALFK